MEPASVESLQLHSKTKGDLAEAFITFRLLSLGKTVLKPVGDNARYDLVVHDVTTGEFHRVQCKTGFLDPRAANVMKFPPCSSSAHAGGAKKHYRGDADFFAVFFPPLQKVYMVPVDHVGRSEASLRLAAARNGQSKGVRLAADYEI